jgi:ATP adenylyltransferase
LWSPWRIGYVAKLKKSGCVFCRMVKENSDKENHIFLRSKHCFGVLNSFPYNNGHLMVIPYRHVAQWHQITDAEILDINNTLKKSLQLCGEILKPHGFNLGVNIGEFGGAGIAGHLHLHIVPRWKGDSNFMPAIADTKVIPQSLNELWKKLTLKIKTHEKI